MNLDMNTHGVDECAGAINSIGDRLRPAIREALKRIGHLVRDTAVSYAPISPTTSLLIKLSKASRKGLGQIIVKGRKGAPSQTIKLTAFYASRLDMLLSKDPRNTKRPMPGGLQSSIMVRTDDNQAEIFVPSNSLAGSYAFKIHEQKGSEWHERGPGTQAKGPQADDKFITRAITDNERTIAGMMDEELTKLLLRK